MALVSLELYPLRGGGVQKPLRAANAFVPNTASFVSVTCSRCDYEGTLKLCAHLSAAGHEPAPHLVGTGRTRAQTAALIERTAAAGYRHVVALRGDPVRSPCHSDEEVGSTRELVGMLSATGAFAEIMVGGYPDVHPEAQSAASDLRHLAGKIEAGATRIITQFCFETDTLCKFRDRLAAMGIAAPISAGILPVRNFAGMLQFADRCKAAVPASLRLRFEQTPPAQRAALADSLLTGQVCELVAAGFDIHFYTLNSAAMLNEAWLAATARQRQRSS